MIRLLLFDLALCPRLNVTLVDVIDDESGKSTRELHRRRSASASMACMSSSIRPSFSVIGLNPVLCCIVGRRFGCGCSAGAGRAADELDFTDELEGMVTVTRHGLSWSMSTCSNK